jgi:outer membrane lipase/esterase
MKFKVDVVRSVVSAGLAMVLLASCGGGTQIEAFVPKRVIVFGDEASLMTNATDSPPAGRKYSVNGVVFAPVVPPATASSGPVIPIELDCQANQIWVQQLAYAFGMSLPGCPTVGYTPSGLSYAAVGAGAAGLTAQVDQFFADGNSFANNDLVTVMAGTHDIIAQYGRLTTEPGVSTSILIAAAGQAGDAVGGQVVRITDRGAKVVVSTIPDLGLAPYALTRDRALLSRLSQEFNDKLRLKLEEVRDGGRAVGLILTHELVLNMAQVPTSYGLSNVSQAVCSVALPDCNITTLVPGAIPAAYGYDWLWADDTRLGATAQSRIGNNAINRARNNPF